eukprot:scaffold9148_cov59-Phaeocystis_antarctica.AAC.9
MVTSDSTEVTASLCVYGFLTLMARVFGGGQQRGGQQTNSAASSALWPRRRRRRRCLTPSRLSPRQLRHRLRRRRYRPRRPRRRCATAMPLAGASKLTTGRCAGLELLVPIC